MHPGYCRYSHGRVGFARVGVLAIIVLIEITILAANGLRRPLTGVAARYTDDRADNFDIYLPLWLARYNKLIFGRLFAAALLSALLLWLWQLAPSIWANGGTAVKVAIAGDKGAEIRDLPKPEPGANEVVIRARASSLNRADLLAASRGGGARLGLECAGEVDAVGSAVTGVKPGDRVLASAAGEFAEYVVTDARRVHRIPANNMTYEQAACLPVALQTMHNAVVTAGRLKRGDTLLMQGASSGIGLMGMQIGKLMGASLVIGTSTNPQRRARLQEFGCDLALDSSDPKWPQEVRKATGDKGVDVIVDMISGSVVDRKSRSRSGARPHRGCSVVCGGNKGEFNFDVHALKRVDYIGVTFRTRSLDEIGEINRLLRADLWPAVEAGKLSLPIYQTYPLDQIAEAVVTDAGEPAFR